MKQLILKEFLRSDLKIISKQKLQDYIDFCISHNIGSRVKGKSSLHHILPNEIFEEYSDLKENMWNGSYLSYADHYIAHAMICDAINNKSMISAWYAMNNKDIKNGRITNPEDLIGPELHQKLMEDRSKNQANINKSDIHINNRRNTMLKINDDGLYSFQVMGAKISDKLKDKCQALNVKTMEKTFISTEEFHRKWFYLGNTAKYVHLVEYDNLYYRNLNQLKNIYPNIKIGRKGKYKHLKIIISDAHANFDFYDSKIVTTSYSSGISFNESTSITCSL